MYSKYIFGEALEDGSEDIKGNGENINNIRYADDTTLLAESINNLKTLIDRVSYNIKYCDLNINISRKKFRVIRKTKMSYDRAKIIIKNQKLDGFKYHQLPCLTSIQQRKNTPELLTAIIMNINANN